MDFDQDFGERCNISELFRQKKLVKICAPMVRYSKLSFRQLVRKYGCDLAFTPMIVSNPFVNSLNARDSDFSTNKGDRPLIVQFAASNATDFADAAEIVYPYSDGLDLNCGCPQTWAMQEGYGACLIHKPELVSDMVSQARARVADSEYSVSIKIRIHKDPKKTVELCRRIEKCGLTFLSVHARTVNQRCEPVNEEALRLIKDSVSIPVVANGDIKSLRDAEETQERTGVDDFTLTPGVMAARGILSNPAMYDGYETTPLECVKDWLDISLSHGAKYHIFHHHLIKMLEPVISRAEQKIFNSLSSFPSVLDFLDQRYHI